MSETTEGLNDLQALGILQLLLQALFDLHLLAHFNGELFDFHALEQFLDRFRTHHGLEAGGTVLLVEFAETRLVLDDLALLDGRITGVDDDVGLEVENGFKLAQRNVEQVGRYATAGP